MTLAWFLQNLLNGLSIGSVYAVFALGYTLVFSILGVINFAHGAVFTLGAYLTYTLAVGEFGLNGLLAGVILPELQGASPADHDSSTRGLIRYCLDRRGA